MHHSRYLRGYHRAVPQMAPIAPIAQGVSVHEPVHGIGTRSLNPATVRDIASASSLCREP